MTMTDVDRIHGELSGILEVVRKSGGPSDVTAAETIATKALLLSAASYFEREICGAIAECAGEGGARPVYVAFIQRQALERKYHTMFSWGESNINRFFSLFGEYAKVKLSASAKEDEINTAIRDFLFLGSKRNELVHENFAGFSLDVTFNDVWNKYTSATRLPNWLRSELSSISTAHG